MVDTPPTLPVPVRGGRSRPLRIALAHDWLCGMRGGEHVLDRLAGLVTREHEAAGLFVMFDDGRPMTSNIDALPHWVSRVGRMPCASQLRRWLLPIYPAAVEQLSQMLEQEHRRSRIDLVISTSSAAVKGLRPPDGVPHLCYCHSPARYVWSQSAQYGGGLRGIGLKLLGGRFRSWDAATAGRVTRFVANSRHTAGEVARCYRREATVVYPPVRTELFTPGWEGLQRQDFWLVVSALEPYKRVEVAIEAANRARHELVIVGDGSQRERLERRAGATVRFEGRVSERDLVGWYRRAKVLIFPQVEDFGIVALEAQACGLPVVARAAGGALESVIDGITGALFQGDDSESLLAAIAKCPLNAGEACRGNAERFREEVFDLAMLREIEAVMHGKAALAETTPTPAPLAPTPSRPDAAASITGLSVT